MTLGSLFDGIGGWLLAARHAGVTPVWASEIEPFPCSVTARHFPDVKQLGDITQIDPDTLPPVDIICAGSPCQDLSIAGKRKGLDGERSGLFRTAVELVRRMRIRTGGRYPRFFVWENVPGAFSSNKGADFRAVLEEIGQTEIPIPPNGKWANAGLAELPQCDIAWRVLDAQYWGVPQRRRRIFLVADFTADGRCAGEILFEPKGMSGYPAADARARERVAGGTADCARTASRVYGFDTRASIAQSAPVLKEATPPITVNNRLGTMAAGFIGKAAPSAGNIGYVRECAPTLIAGKEQHVALYDIQHRQDVVRPIGDMCNTLTARMGTGGNNVPIMHNFSIVRRLTPTECERLQGLEDGYTDGGSDTARYKALGNGMAQPCADYVIRRIVECAEEVR